MSLVKRIRKARRVYVVGNGGSFATAMHIVGDLEEAKIKAHALNPASLTRTGNDKGYERIFSDWIALHGEKGDLLIALSGSGTSPNILKAIKTAKRIWMDTELISWYLKDGMDMEMSEETMLTMGHQWKRSLKKR